MSSLVPPKPAQVLLRTEAEGVQIYVCEVLNGTFEWRFKAPEAALFDENGLQVATHFAGPSWQASDGSLVTGEVAAKAAAPAKDAIPWLLLKAKSHEGLGQFARVSYIQRTDTKGGSAPSSGCDSAHQGQAARIRYGATYTFFADGP
jgi:hypothetical protein